MATIKQKSVFICSNMHYYSRNVQLSLLNTTMEYDADLVENSTTGCIIQLNKLNDELINKLYTIVYTYIEDLRCQTYESTFSEESEQNDQQNM